MAGYIGTQAVSVNTTSATISDDLTVGDDVKLAHDGAVLGFGADNEITLTHGHNEGLTFNGSSTFNFRNGDSKIHSSADNQLDLIAATEIEMTTPLVEMSGALSVIGNRSGDYQTKLISTNTYGLFVKTTSTSASHEQLLVHDGNGAVNFKVLGNGAATIKQGLTLTDGNLTVAAGHGIDFSAQTQSSAQTNEELLNHYEQGVFTPTLVNSGGVAVDAYTAAVGAYVRVGARVHCHGYIIANGISNLGSGNAILLGGFPFDAVNVTNGHSPLCMGYGQGLNITAGHHIGGYLGPNSTNATVQLWDVATGTSNMTFGELSADGGFMFSISYNAV